MPDQQQPAGPPSDIKIVVDPHCSDIFIDGVIGATVRDGIVRMNLVNIRSKPDGREQEHAVVGRLILSRSAARNLHNALGQVMSSLYRREDRAAAAPTEPEETEQP